jgi:Zn-dependent protease
MTELTIIQQVCVWVLPILFAITVHEVAHGYMAYWLGDKTPKILGRLTLNPLKHIDLIGTVIVPVLLMIFGGIIIGWAKPVPINSRHLRKPKRDLALIALAGPMANFIMMILWASVAKVGALLGARHFPGSLGIFYMGYAGITVNIWLMVLNLIPIPPLDGGHILFGLLPKKLAFRFDKIAPYGFFVVLFLLAIGVMEFVINPITGWLLELVRFCFKISF